MSIEIDIKEHALLEFPKECVGYVSDGKYYRLRNISKNPEKRYQLSIEDKMKLFKMGERVTALVHSHPVLDNNPSEIDKGAQESVKIPFWIIGTDGENTTNIKELDL